MAGVNIRMIRSIQQKQAKLLDLALQNPRIGQDPSQILMIFLQEASTQGPAKLRADGSGKTKSYDV